MGFTFRDQTQKQNSEAAILLTLPKCLNPKHTVTEPTRPKGLSSHFLSDPSTLSEMEGCSGKQNTGDQLKRHLDMVCSSFFSFPSRSPSRQVYEDVLLSQCQLARYISVPEACLPGLICSHRHRHISTHPSATNWGNKSWNLCLMVCYTTTKISLRST